MKTVGSLFAGIGGFDLGFERAGFTTLWQVEKNAYCRRVLRRHFPDASRKVTDVRFAGARNLIPVDVICGGFPCQDISNAGKRAGIYGARSGLWFHMCRIVGELRPQYVVVENVRSLLGRGISRVLGDLSEIGYDAEWQIISAAEMGAPHLRERVWIVARGQLNSAQAQSSADSDCHDVQRIFGGVVDKKEWQKPEKRQTGPCYPSTAGMWLIEPDVGRVAHGIPNRVDRLKSLGNSLVPQIAELIAKRIVAVSI